MKILVIDNYDSFVYNLVHYLEIRGAQTVIVRNDDPVLLDSDWVRQMDGILLSPGPCTPAESGYIADVIQSFSNHKPILGICLGHQAIGVAFGCALVHARSPVHGRASLIQYNQDPVFEGLNNPFPAGRYHSLAIAMADPAESEMKVIARTEDGEIMGVRHRLLPVLGLQFHPESILTPDGLQIITNWLQEVRLFHQNLMR